MQKPTRHKSLEQHERVRWVPGYEGCYSVTSKGKIFSHLRPKPGQPTSKWSPSAHPRAQLNPSEFSDGYLYVTLREGKGRKKKATVHSLVLKAFVGEPSEGECCCHNNGDPQDNRLENLRWDRYANNTKDRIKHGTYSKKIDGADVMEIRTLCDTGNEISELAVRYGVSESYIRGIVRGDRWKHIGGPIREDGTVAGSSHHNAKFTEESVRQLRQDYKDGKFTHRGKAKELGVAFTTIGRIVRGQAWAHAGGPIKGVDY